MNIEHMKSLSQGHQLRGQSGQLFLVRSLRGPCAYYFAGRCLVIGQLAFISSEPRVLFPPSVGSVYSGSAERPAEKCQQAIKSTLEANHAEECINLFTRGVVNHFLSSYVFNLI